MAPRECVDAAAEAAAFDCGDDCLDLPRRFFLGGILTKIYGVDKRYESRAHTPVRARPRTCHAHQQLDHKQLKNKLQRERIRSLNICKPFLRRQKAKEPLKLSKTRKQPKKWRTEDNRLLHPCCACAHGQPELR